MEVDPGLCGACRHARVLETRSGSRFYLCELSRVLPQFPRYPRLPVMRCDGFEPSGGNGEQMNINRGERGDAEGRAQ